MTTLIDLFTLLAALGFCVAVMGRALLWRFVDLAEQDVVVGPAAWFTAIIVAWVLSVLVSLRADLLWVS